jgi:hypothetical protein
MRARWPVVILAILVAVGLALAVAYVIRGRPPAPLPSNAELARICAAQRTEPGCRTVRLFRQPVYDVGHCAWTDGACRFHLDDPAPEPPP